MPFNNLVVDGEEVDSSNPLPVATVASGAAPTDPFGVNADAASATGSISAKLRGIATALGVTALDLGSGTGGTRTLRVFPDTASVHLVADNTVAITVAVTLTVGASYASGDHVGTSGAPISFANAVRTSGGSATLRSVTISDPAASAAVALELWLFSATITPPADSAAWDLSDAAGLTCVGIVSIPTTAQFLSSATGVMHVGNLGLQFHCAATTLFGALVTRGAPTYTGSLQVKLEIEYDQ